MNGISKDEEEEITIIGKEEPGDGKEKDEIKQFLTYNLPDPEISKKLP
jgi:hypothetical protein